MKIVEIQKSISFLHQENKKIMHFKHILIFFFKITDLKYYVWRPKSGRLKYPKLCF